MDLTGGSVCNVPSCLHVRVCVCACSWAFLAFMDPTGGSACSVPSRVHVRVCVRGALLIEKEWTFSTLQRSWATDGMNGNEHSVRVSVVHYFAMLIMRVFVVMNFERIMQFWLGKCPKLREEHGTYKGLVETLTEELVKLCTCFAAHTGWRTYSDHRPKYQGTKWTRDGRRRAKTALEQLSSTDESEEEDAPEGRVEEGQQRHEHRGGDQEFAAVLESIGMGGGQTIDEATSHLVAQHVHEFVRERLSPTTHIKDALAWWATKEATWPMVAAVARHSLCVPASAACSERGFSATGHIVRARRARLSDEKIEELSHLSNNLEADP